jgi:hypothetical protein
MRPLFESLFVPPTHDNNKDVKFNHIDLASIPNRTLAVHALLLILPCDCNNVMRKVMPEQFQLVHNEALIVDNLGECLFLMGPAWHPLKKVGGSAIQQQWRDAAV